MSEKTFRFGVVAPVGPDVAAWRGQLRRIAGLGYATVLVPDVPGWQPAPAVSLAVAASITDLRVGTWVYASPLRTARQLADEAHSLTQLTEGRFEFGVGAGRPGIEEVVEELGMAPTTPGQRWDRVREAVTILRELDGPDRHTPVAMAAGGPRARAVAAELADTVPFPLAPHHTRVESARFARELRARRDIEFANHVPVVGETVAPYMTGPDTDAAALHATQSLLALPGDPAAAVDEIRRRREELGLTYVVVGSGAAELLAPVVAELAGT